MKVTKYSGEVVTFEKDKLKKSLFKSGASEADVNRVLETIEKQLYDGIPTKKIYKMAFQLLKKIANVHAAKYNLRTAIMALGPAGFYFEKFIAKLFQMEGFETMTNLTLNGKCVSHELDVLLRKNEKISMVECKFHSSQDAKTNVKVPMYILSRFNDLAVKEYTLFNETHKISKCKIVTNNRFTEDAVQFATCSNMELLSWNYPSGSSLKNKIDSYHIYPVTALTTLTLLEKDKLLTQNIITAKELLTNKEWLNKIGLSQNRIKNVLKETNQLCNILNY
ncbi:restriction endonuclease [uncultured Flavobacterium sp.]|uniref:restriction endonuclease n=1 Tax=uncultured Flavobacterium sp. TaxID=165435 RepID=UPI0030EC6008|tara:strand:- start:201 stop:1037 length:837 start_codon:yes stop_codon:yes gene_type:complete